MLRPSRAGVIHLSLMLVAAALVVRAGYVQLWEGSVWAEHGAREHSSPGVTALARGPIVDADGNPLAITRSVVQFSVAPQQVTNRPAVARALTRAGINATVVRHALDSRRGWVTLPDHVLPGDAAAAAALRGVYTSPLAERVPMGGDGTAAITGHVVSGAGADGVEAALDTVLRGDTSKTLVLRDGLGRPLESPATKNSGVWGGDTVILTVNRALQEICERSLDDAVTRMAASGGDIVVLDPQSGDILALASQRRGMPGPASTTLTEPFEPGSTIKPFIAAPLIARGRVSPTDVVDTHTGRLTLHGRTLTDTHRAPAMTLREVIRWSSNVGIAQFAQRLSAREEYEGLRDVGFGSPTGLPFPGEAAGTLHDPSEWSKQSPASLAIGYELAVTPLQLALAYATIANGGELLEPGLVREIRGPDGSVRFRRTRRVVRRVMPEAVAAELRDILVETVVNGTAAEADLPSYIVAGKTGTARRTEYGAGYGRNEYTASFVGLFPGRDPQYVILVKLDDPTSSYYGGKTAAPVFKTVLEAALAARNPGLDREALAADRRARAPQAVPLATPDTVAADVVMPVDSGIEPSITLAVGTRTPAAESRPARATTTVPDVRTLTIRSAVRALHAADLRIQLVSGPLGATDPASGTVVRAGGVVRLGDGS